MKLIFFCSLRARQSEVYITAKALAGSNFSPVVAPPGGRQCHKSIWRDGLRSFAHMSHAWSVNDNAKGHFLVVAVCRQYQQERETDRERAGEIDRESRKATLLPHFRLREHEVGCRATGHTLPANYVNCSVLPFQPGLHNVTCDQVKCQVTFKSSFRTVANCINCPQWERQREREREQATQMLTGCCLSNWS